MSKERPIETEFLKTLPTFPGTDDLEAHLREKKIRIQGELKPSEKEVIERKISEEIHGHFPEHSKRHTHALCYSSDFKHPPKAMS